MKIILLMERMFTSNWFIRLLMVCVVGVMVMSAAFFNVGKDNYVNDGALWMALGALTLLLILLVMWNYPPSDHTEAHGRTEARPYTSPKARYRIRWIFVCMGILSLAILAEMNGYVFRIPQLRHVSSHIQFAGLGHWRMALQGGAISGQKKRRNREKYGGCASHCETKHSANT
jgi:hypothetical protein